MEGKGASKLLIPERFEFVDALPMTEAGKHNKKVLREDIKKKIGSWELKKTISPQRHRGHGEAFFYLAGRYRQIKTFLSFKYNALFMQ